MDEAKRLGDYIVQNHHGKIDTLYGISYGSRILHGSSRSPMQEVLGEGHWADTRRSRSSSLRQGDVAELEKEKR